MLAKRLALLARDLALEKKAEEPVILDIHKLSSMASFFVIMHGNSDPHVRAIGEFVQDELKKKKERPLHVEGFIEGKWVLMDYGSVIIHVFYRPVREFYGLERLWGNAKIVT